MREFGERVTICPWKVRSLAVLLILLLTVKVVRAAEPLVVVTDPWPPYAMEVDGEVVGADADITRAVFRRLGIAVDIQLCPWKRCLMRVKTQGADAILDASFTVERSEYLYFPDEPVSSGATILFIQKGRSLPFSSLDDLKDLRVGALLGYRYCEDVDRASFMQEAARVNSLTQNFKKLLAGRIDVVIEVDAVGYFTAKEMGVLDQVDVVPGASFCQGGNYLAFSKKPGNKQLASRFSTALRAFKKTDEYVQILKEYGIE